MGRSPSPSPLRTATPPAPPCQGAPPPDKQAPSSAASTHSPEQDELLRTSTRLALAKAPRPVCGTLPSLAALKRTLLAPAISSNCIETATVRGFLRANVGTGHSTLHAARGTRIWHFVVKERGAPCLYLNYSADTRRGAEVEESVHRSILRMCASLSEAPYPQACDTASAAVRGRMNNTCLYLEDSAREALALEESWAAIDLAILAAAFERLTRQGIAKNPGPPEPARAGKTWKREEETRLEVACTPSATYQSLADELGRTPLAIQVKLHQMGLRESPPSTLAAIKDHPFRKKHAVAPTATSEPAEPQGTNRGTREILERAKRTLSPAPQNTPRAIGALEGVPMPRATVGSPRFQSSPPEKRRGHGAVSTPPRVDDPMQVGKRASTAHPGGGATPDAPPKKAGKAKKDVPTPVALNRVLTMGTRTPLKKPVKMPAVEPSVNIADLVAERTELMGQRTLVGSKEHARLIVITQILAAVVRPECTGHDPAQADATVDFRDLAAPAAPPTHAVSAPTPEEDVAEGTLAERTVNTADRKAVKAATAKLSAGGPKAIRKAVRILDQDKTEINGTSGEILAKMFTLHPHRRVNDDGSEIPFPEVPAGDHTCQDVHPEALIDVVASLMNLVAPAESGLTEELLYAAVACQDLPVVAEIVAAMVTDIRNARVDKAAARALRRCRAIAAGKPGEGLCLRPIAIGECIVKVAATLDVYEVSHHLAEKFGDVQLGLAKLGCERVAQACQKAIDDDPEVATMTIDATNAFNTACRFVIAKELYNDPKLSALFLLFDLMNNEAGDLILTLDGRKYVIKSSDGTRQGDVLGSILFCIAIHPILLRAKSLFPGVTIMAIMDDINFWGKTDVVLQAYEYMVKELAELRLVANNKTTLYPPAVEHLTDTAVAAIAALEAAKAITVDRRGVKIVGTMRSRDDGYVRQFLDAKMAKGANLFRRMAMLPPMQAFTILQKCGAPRATYLIRTHRPELTSAYTVNFDAQTRVVLEHVVRRPLEGASRETEVLAHLPPRQGGKGITRTA